MTNTPTICPACCWDLTERVPAGEVEGASGDSTADAVHLRMALHDVWTFAAAARRAGATDADLLAAIKADK